MSITSNFSNNSFLSLSLMSGATTVATFDDNALGSNLSIKGTTSSSGYPTSITNMQYTYGISVVGTTNALLNRGLLLWNSCSGGAGSGVSIDWANYSSSTPSAQIISTDNGISANYFSLCTRTSGAASVVKPIERIRINTDTNTLINGNLGVRNGTTQPIYPLDFGSNAYDKTLAVYYNGGNSFYGLGANNSALQYQVPASSGHSFNIGGTSIFSLNANNFASTVPIIVLASSNVNPISFAILNNSLPINSNESIIFGVAASTQNCAYLNYANNNGVLVGGLGFYGANNDAMNFGRNNYLGINNNNPAFPLDVAGDTGTTFTLTYPFYVNRFSTAVTGPANNYNGSFSCRIQGAVVAYEFWGLSDVRYKTDIEDLGSVISAQHFLENIEPKTYNWKSEEKLSYGYIAQDMLKHGYKPLVKVTEGSDLDEFIDSEGFCSQKGTLVHLSYEKIVPIIHLALLDLEQQVNLLQDKFLAF